MKRGSALLIVLGMLSFMVVSAVGFSVYMRQGRLPSSYLRRNVASRYLVKAALANAIEELDCGWMSIYDIGEADGTSDNDHKKGRMFGIHNDPFPGCGPDNTPEKNTMNSGERSLWFNNANGEQEVRLDYNKNGDFWFNRVFCPFGPLPYPNSSGASEDTPPITVPTLTLEALAYLPPAIVDDVRKMSRVTRTATWRSLPYEAGRYAYTAVNVSDLFDINRLQANVPRDSGPNRITLATLTSTDPTDPTAVDANNAQAIDAIVGDMKKQEIPFVSLADFNLAAALGGGKDYAPVMQFFGQQNKAYSDLAKANNAVAANAMFVTDTWFPPTNTLDTTYKTYNLADGSGQPFKNFTANSVLTVLGSLNDDAQVQQLYQKNLGLGLACLYDYLDGDSVPISLAIPTTEPVPMVVGVSAPLGIAPMVGNIGNPISSNPYSVPGTDSDGNQVQVQMIRTVQQVGFVGLGNRLQLNVLLTYPFKRMQTSKRIKTDDFKVRAILKMFLAPDGMGCRPNNGLRLLYPTKNDVTAAMGQGWSAANGIATVLSDNFASGQDISDFNADVKTTADAIKPILLQFSQLGVQMPFYWTVSEAPSPQNPAGYTPSQTRQPYKSLDGLKTSTDALRPLGVEGGVDDPWSQTVANNRIEDGLNTQQGPVEFAGLTTTYRLYSAVWVQILDRNGKVVDMAPATVADDEWNGRPSVGGAVLSRLDGSDMGVPLLNFKSATAIPFDTALETTLVQPPSFAGWQTLYAVDPRFNFASEDWFSSSAAVVSANDWITAIKPLLGADGRDRDIFMFVSNQEYLQSIGELQFLPFLQDTNDNGAFMDGDYSAVYSRNPFSDRPNATDVTKFAHGENFLWRSYCAYKLNDSVPNLDYEYANPYTIVKNGQVIPFPVQCDAGGFKLNPYSDDNRVIAAATVLTPYDYYVASTNTLENSLDADAKTRKADLVANLKTLQQMKSTYSFGDSPCAQLSADRLMDINDAIFGAFSQAARNGGSDWMKAWNDRMLMEWQEEAQNKVNDDNNRFLGIDLDAASILHGVDRKYLYSFWRECFDNRQQLFLIFVRAEPASVGGGSAGNVSSAQLGGRAVALVWRDPQGPETTSRPSDTIDRSSFRSQYKKSHRPHRTRILFYHQFD